MSILESPGVNFHVDDDLECVRGPTVFALFIHVITAIKVIQERIDQAISDSVD